MRRLSHFFARKNKTSGASMKTWAFGYQLGAFLVSFVKPTYACCISSVRSNFCSSTTRQEARRSEYVLPYDTLSTRIPCVQKINAANCSCLASAKDSSESVTDRSVNVTVPVLLMLMSYMMRSPGTVSAGPLSPFCRAVVAKNVNPDNRRRSV